AFHGYGAEERRRQLRRMPQVNRHTGRRYWTRIALVNAAGALAVVGVSGGFAPGVSWGALARGFGVSMIYANTIGTMLAMLMPLIAKRCWSANHRTRWAVLLSGMLVVIVAGILLANTLLYSVGYIPRGQFWRWLSG